MIALKIIYVCWIAFFAFLWIISPAVVHNPDRVEEFFIMLGLDIAPLLIYSLCALVIKRNKRYLKMFFILLLYYPLGYIINSICYFGFDGFYRRMLFFTYQSLMGN